MSHYNDWERTEGISGVINCGTWRKFCMRMKRVKSRKGERFGKQFEGVHWENLLGNWLELSKKSFREKVYHSITTNKK